MFNELMIKIKKCEKQKINDTYTKIYTLYLFNEFRNVSKILVIKTILDFDEFKNIVDNHYTKKYHECGKFFDKMDSKNYDMTVFRFNFIEHKMEMIFESKTLIVFKSKII